MLTEIEIQEALALCEAATPGPWRHEQRLTPQGEVSHDVVVCNEGETIAQCADTEYGGGRVAREACPLRASRAGSAREHDRDARAGGVRQAWRHVAQPDQRSRALAQCDVGCPRRPNRRTTCLSD